VTKRKAKPEATDVEDVVVESQPEGTEAVAEPAPASSAVAVVGAPGSIVRPDKSGELAATVAEAPDRSVIVLRSEDDRLAVQHLLKAAGKKCAIAVQPGIGPRSLWRKPRGGR
jgi:hypothetical protein